MIFGKANNKNSSAQVVITTLALTSATVPYWNIDASAAGFALREYGFSAASNSFAGSSAQSDEAAFLAYNPATSSGTIEWDAQFTLNAIYPTSDALYSIATTSTGANISGSKAPDDFIQDAYEPGLSFRYRINEKWTAGLSVTAPWGLGTKYNENWAGRYYAVQSKLLTVNTTPSLAYQLLPNLTLAAGLQIQYAQGTLSNAIDFGSIGFLNGVPGSNPGTQDGFVEIEASDWAVGYTLGALWSPTPDFSLGFSYRSALEHDLEGSVDFRLDTTGVGAALSGFSGAFIDTDGRAKLNLPAITTLGMSLKATEKLTLLAEVGLTEWSDFKELRVKFSNPLQPDNFQTYDWKDTWLIAGGIKYEATPDWIVRSGIAIDQTPTRDATRDPRIPDATRTWASIGFEHKLSPSTSLQLGYARLIFPQEPISLSAATAGNEVRGNLSGTTDADADMISFQLSFR